MSEKLIRIDSGNPVEIFGVNDQKLNLLTRHFSKIKIIARGGKLKVIGDQKAIDEFEQTFGKLVEHLNKYGELTEQNIENILDGTSGHAGSKPDANAVVFGPNGTVIKARSINQARLVESISDHDLVFAVGPAGSGKTYTSVALAVRALKNKEVKRIILTRPAVEAGENLGFLPGDLKDKLDPYMQPLYDALSDMLPNPKLKSHLENGIIQIAPLAFMRGRTLDHAFVILDEAQNATINQMKMFLTRMGKAAKFIVTGDITQIDLPKQQRSGLIHAMEILHDIPDIKFIRLDHGDIIRHKLVPRIVKAYTD